MTAIGNPVPQELPGRVSDSPIIGAGLYVDDNAGGGTGVGEEEPSQACLLRRGGRGIVQRMPRKQRPPDDFDSPWKDALQRFLHPFLEFFFHAIAADIDWSRGYESLDKEFQQIIRRARLGKTLADKLFKVWLRDGTEHWLLIHIEVQATPDPTLPRRMFRYNVSANALYDIDVVSIAVLCDTDPNWRPGGYSYGHWGSRTGIDYLSAKLLDHLADQQALEVSSNPFAAVVLAHSQALATQDDPQTRRDLKLQLAKGLYKRGWDTDDVRELLRIIDWIMTLPDDLENEFREDLHRYEEEITMPYVTSFERLAKEEGREEGRQEGERKTLCEVIGDDLQEKFGPRGRRLLPKVRALEDVAALRVLRRELKKATTFDEARELVSRRSKANGTST